MSELKNFCRELMGASVPFWQLSDGHIPGKIPTPEENADLNRFLNFWSPVITAEIIRRGGDAKDSFFVFEKIHPDMTMRDFDKLLQEAVKCS